MPLVTQAATTAPVRAFGPENVSGGRSNTIAQVMSLPPYKDWSGILQSSLDRLQLGSPKTGSFGHHLGQMTELLRIQSDISRYQLKVELVSKVSEGAVASVRKLQQNQ